MHNLQILTGCELHVHSWGCLYPEDFLDLGQGIYQDVDWTRHTTLYQEAYGEVVEPRQLYAEALRNETGMKRFRQHVVFNGADGGDFLRFQAKFTFGGALQAHLIYVLGRDKDALRHVIDHHRREGLDYVVYRSLFGPVEEYPEYFFKHHITNAEVIKEMSDDQLTARYLPSLPRETPEKAYDMLQQLLDQRPDLIETIVGIDFCGIEEGFPPKIVANLFKRLHQDNKARPERALQVAYHVGESYFDKSLESAVRWCHEAAAMGAKRLGHAIALGLDPAAAISRRPQAHETELVSERLDQIAYDLQYQEELRAYGVIVDGAKLGQEAERLQKLSGDGLVARPYTHQRLEENRRRQDFVLDRLTELGTVIETCPTSNLRIGGVPSPVQHPVHRFLRSNVNLVICADDPGTFDSPLATEVEWVLQHTDYEAAALVERLGDPRRFRFTREHLS